MSVGASGSLGAEWLRAWGSGALTLLRGSGRPSGLCVPSTLLCRGTEAAQRSNSFLLFVFLVWLTENGCW